MANKHQNNNYLAHYTPHSSSGEHSLLIYSFTDNCLPRTEVRSTAVILFIRYCFATRGQVVSRGGKLWDLIYPLQFGDGGDELVAEADGVAFGGEEDAVEGVGEEEVRHPVAFEVETVRDDAQMDVGRKRGGIFL